MRPSVNNLELLRPVSGRPRRALPAASQPLPRKKPKQQRDYKDSEWNRHRQVSRRAVTRNTRQHSFTSLQRSPI